MQPLAEVFGFPISNETAQAAHFRSQCLCPYNNKVPNCTKDKANAPLGVCSVFHGETAVITCPIRFRENWQIVADAASFFFEKGATWTSLTEVRLADRNGQSVGNIDFVLVQYDEKGQIVDFGSLEVQGVYISGNLRNPFEAFLENPSKIFDWKGGLNYPKPDFLSSSRKRLVPQMLYKGGIFKNWKKKQAVALQKAFFNTLPALPRCEKKVADIAWFLYDLVFEDASKRFKLELVEIVFTEFEPALLKIITPEIGPVGDFVQVLQTKLDGQKGSNQPDAPSLSDLLQSET